MGAGGSAFPAFLFVHPLAIFALHENSKFVPCKITFFSEQKLCSRNFFAWKQCGTPTLSIRPKKDEPFSQVVYRRARIKMKGKVLEKLEENMEKD